VERKVIEKSLATVNKRRLNFLRVRNGKPQNESTAGALGQLTPKLATDKTNRLQDGNAAQGEDTMFNEEEYT